jgi:RimJ/RimL family protein N-acetyltransferase
MRRSIACMLGVARPTQPSRERNRTLCTLLINKLVKKTIRRTGVQRVIIRVFPSVKQAFEVEFALRCNMARSTTRRNAMNQNRTRATAPIAKSNGRSHANGREPVLVRELTVNDRERLLAHFLSLNADDRLLRFGQAVPDHVIENYVRTIDFTRDNVFGVFDAKLTLVGVGHLAYLPAEDGSRTAELGVSVRQSSRGKGIGTQLFERATMRCRNTHVTTLYMYCLSRNTTMMHIAKKAGMRIEYAYGSADAYLTLPPADQASIMTEMLHEQAAVFDYAIKRQVRRTAQIIEAMMSLEPEVAA